MGRVGGNDGIETRRREEWGALKYSRCLPILSCRGRTVDRGDGVRGTMGRERKRQPSFHVEVAASLKWRSGLSAVHSRGSSGCHKIAEDSRHRPYIYVMYAVIGVESGREIIA
jgi:hypothetical protein